MFGAGAHSGASPAKIGHELSRRDGLSQLYTKEPYNWRGAKTHALRHHDLVSSGGFSCGATIANPGLNIFVLGNVARNADLAAAPRKFPLILMSHGTGGTALSLAWLGTALAAHGYIVAGVNHPGNNAVEPYTVEGFSTWWERARDLSEVIDALLKDSTFGTESMRLALVPPVFL